VGLLIGYALSVTLVFKHRRFKDQRLEFAGFAVICAVGAAINAAAIAFGVRYLGLHYFCQMRSGRIYLSLEFHSASQVSFRSTSHNLKINRHGFYR
jgi:putative flippase GtrA